MCEVCEVWSVSDVCCESEVFVVAGTDIAHNTHNDTHTLSQHLMYREKSVSFESSVPVSAQHVCHAIDANETSDWCERGSKLPSEGSAVALDTQATGLTLSTSEDCTPSYQKTMCTTTAAAKYRWA